MATFTASPSNWTNSSDANFRAWGSYIAARFLAVGFVQTADTGQINWTTVTAPAGATTYQGYEIWRFADTLQATAPIFFKAEYGSTATSGNNPGMRITFGSGSDGAGNLTGTLSTSFTVGANASASGTTLYGSGSTNRFVMATTTYTSGNMWWFGFERTRDASGNPTSEGLYWFSHPTNSSGSIQIGFYNRSTGMVGPSPGSSNVFAALFPQSTGITGVQTIVAPIFPEKGIFGNPILSAVGYYTGDIAPGGTPTIYMYGQPHTYYCLGASNGPAGADFRGAGAGTEAMAILYE